ncbi:MAG: hypothetical protein K6347_07410 [Campylobacterales bacterium]
MKYSFTKARSKKLLKTDTKLWILFFVTVMTMLGGFHTYIRYQQAHANEWIEELAQTTRVTQERIKKVEREIQQVTKEAELADKVVTHNTIMIDSLRNLFDLIPDEIVLTKVVMEPRTLVLYGSAPSKEVYDYLLYPPLKSIFTTTQTSFYRAGSRVHFVSISKLEGEDATQASSDHTLSIQGDANQSGGAHSHQKEKHQ